MTVFPSVFKAAAENIKAIPTMFSVGRSLIETSNSALLGLMVVIFFSVGVMGCSGGEPMTFDESGLSDVPLGSSVTELIKAKSVELIRSTEGNSVCRGYQLKNHYNSELWAFDDEITHLFIRCPSVKTTQNIGLGASFKEVQIAYPEMKPMDANHPCLWVTRGKVIPAKLAGAEPMTSHLGFVFSGCKNAPSSGSKVEEIIVAQAPDLFEVSACKP